MVPCYKVKAHILDVIAKAPAWVEGIVCVDDACPEHSGDFIEANVGDPRVVVVIRLAQNQGVGGATMAGYREAIARGGQVLVKVDGDDQMDLRYVSHLVAPILLGEADYAKGNRFTSMSHLPTMPPMRVLGNAAALSFAAKLSTGYWNIFDPTNGYTAIEAQVASAVIEKRVSRRFFFETDLLYHLGTLRAVVRDVPMPARYGGEASPTCVHRSAIVGPFALEAREELPPPADRPVFCARLLGGQPGDGGRRGLHADLRGGAMRCTTRLSATTDRRPRPAWSWPRPCR